MEELFNEYILAFDEINALTAYIYSNSNNAIDDILSILINAYRQGTEVASKMLNYEVNADTEDMLEAIYVLIDGKTWEDRAREHIDSNNMSELQTLVESEYHRIYNTAIQNTAESYHIETGSTVTKTWITLKDNKVRETHRYLEGMTVGIDEMFVTYDRDFAQYPGGFTKAGNNVNCRCVIRLNNS